jgi:hypothetical protein
MPLFSKRVNTLKQKELFDIEGKLYISLPSISNILI